MRNILTGFLVFVIGSFSLTAQNKHEIAEDELCDFPPGIQRMQPVESFKDSLTLSIDLSELYIGKKTKEIEFVYSEIITSESSLIKVNDDMAIRISVARVIDNGENFYLYKIHLFQKYKDCWFDKNADGSWSIGNIGTFNSGFYHGKIGEDCFGYKGLISIN